MARTITPSSPSALMDAPFIEFGVRMSAIEKLYYAGSESSYMQSHGLPFMNFALLLMHFLKGASLISGNEEQLRHLMRLINTNRYADALEHFQTTEGWEIKFPWTKAHTDFDAEPWRRLCGVYGSDCVEDIKNVLGGVAANIIYGGWLGTSDTMSRNTVKISPVSGYNPVRIDCLTMDLWFPKLEQGIRIDGKTRKFLDLSEGPLEGYMESLDSQNFGFYAGHYNIPMRSWNPRFTLAENMTFNLILTYLVTKLTKVQYFSKDDEFWQNIRSNIPLGAYFGNQIVIPQWDAPPVVTLHNTPGDLYQMLRSKLPDGHTLRQGGLFVAPSSKARQAGTAATLSLVGKNATTSHRRKRAGYLLYDRDTAETLKDALAVRDSTFAGHEMFEDYLDWYKEMRSRAARITVKMGEPAPKWGKWGFNPWRFAELPENARLFVKVLPEVQ